MSLQFILGNSGSGKSHYLYQQIVNESMEHPEKNADAERFMCGTSERRHHEY